MSGEQKTAEDLLVEMCVTMNNICRHYDNKDEKALEFTMTKAYELSHKSFGHLRALDRSEEENAALKTSLSELTDFTESLVAMHAHAYAFADAEFEKMAAESKAAIDRARALLNKPQSESDKTE